MSISGLSVPETHGIGKAGQFALYLLVFVLLQTRGWLNRQEQSKHAGSVRGPFKFSSKPFSAMRSRRNGAGNGSALNPRGEALTSWCKKIFYDITSRSPKCGCFHCKHHQL